MFGKSQCSGKVGGCVLGHARSIGAKKFGSNFGTGWAVWLSPASKLLKELVGASGFEPPTSWSRTRRSSQAEPRPEPTESAGRNRKLHSRQFAGRLQPIRVQPKYTIVPLERAFDLPKRFLASYHANLHERVLVLFRHVRTTPKGRSMREMQRTYYAL